MVILLRNQMAAEDVFSFQEFLPEDERKHRPPAMSGRRIFYIRQTCERRNGYVSFYRSDENRRKHYPTAPKCRIHRPGSTESLRLQFSASHLQMAERNRAADSGQSCRSSCGAQSTN